MVEGGNASSIHSVTKISEVDMTLPQKMKCVIRDNSRGKDSSYKHSKPLLRGTYCNVLSTCTVYCVCVGGEAAPEIHSFNLRHKWWL